MNVNECRDSMKSFIIRIMLALFISTAAAMYYHGSQQAETNTKIVYMTEQIANLNKTIRKSKKERNAKDNKIFKQFSIIVNHSNAIFERCCDARLVQKKKKSSGTAVQ